MNRDDAICKANRIITNRAHTLGEVEELVPPIAAALIAAYNAGLEDSRMICVEKIKDVRTNNDPPRSVMTWTRDRSASEIAAAIRARKIT